MRKFMEKIALAYFQFSNAIGTGTFVHLVTTLKVTKFTI